MTRTLKSPGRLQRLVFCFAVLFAADVAAAENQQEKAQVDYVRDIKPLLANSCAACHGALKQESGLRLDAHRLALRGGDSGPIIAAGDSERSLLMERVTAEGDERMPPEGEGEALDPKKIALLRAWIDAGAIGPENETIPPDPRSHWAYRTPVKVQPPQVAQRGWSDNPIDAFLAAKHAELRLVAAEPASRRVWIRRVYLDLIGLPPTRSDVEAFLNDPSKDAVPRVVERLLKSPQYGERWGRHWMDVWRYSDWSGYRNEVRNSQRHIWRWRDWIIQSLNADKPYDLMVLQMLAGDELAPDEPEVLAATGSLARNWYRFNRNVWLDSTVEHTSKAFLGTTINCARCHDHKYDPISQANYYELRAIFEPHKTRTDQVGEETDLTKNGLPRVYDADLKTPTYLFARGNEKHPQKDAPLSPGLPAVFVSKLNVEPVPLPVSAYYPYLQPDALQSLGQGAVKAVQSAQQQLDTARKQLADKTRKLAKFSVAKPRPVATTSKNADEDAKRDDLAKPGARFLVDDFAKQRDELWTRLGGEWKHENGRLIQSKVNLLRSELLSKEKHPRDFVARLKFKIVGGRTYHSVGLSFDCQGDSTKASRQTVYLSAHPPEPKVQIAQSLAGADSYPPSGKVKLDIERGGEYFLEVAVRDRLMNVSVDGQLQLAYETPHPRTDGKFSVWAFDCAAEFISVEVSELPLSVPLQKSATPTPLAKRNKLTKADLQVEVDLAESALKLAELKLTQSQVSAKSLTARIAADRAKYGTPGEGSEPRSAEKVAELATEAGAMKQQLAIITNSISVLSAKQALRKAEIAAAKSKRKKEKDAFKKAKAELTKSETALAKAKKAATKPSQDYAPLGTEYPRTSSGRRLAFAKWIVDRQNPLAARVAVNHIWMRHFGAPLVSNAFDFGLRSSQPAHHKLLDWLAVELMEHDWSMKHIHRLIVTSSAYGMNSQSSEHEENKKVDPDNQFLWQMNARRLEAEVVRDAVLHVAGNLDLSMGGPEIDHNQGQSTRRRSVYFRHAYEKKMKFLELFDAANETDCYRRSDSVIPQQALAMSNSQLLFSQSRLLARKLAKESSGDSEFVRLVFEQVLGRPPSAAEATECVKFLKSQSSVLLDKKKLSKFSGGGASQVQPSDDAAMRSRENLVHVMMNHNDFVTVR